MNFLKMPWGEKVISIRRKILPAFRKGYGAFGKNSDIYKPMMIRNKKHIFIGNNVTIRNYARIEPIVKWNGEKYKPVIKIGNNVSIEQGLHLTCANEVIIEDDCTIVSNVMLTDINHKYRGSGSILRSEIEVGKTVVGKGSFIGKNVCIMPGVTIGKYCVVGANAVVTHDIPDYAVAAGVPAKVIKINNGGNE